VLGIFRDAPASENHHNSGHRCIAAITPHSINSSAAGHISPTGVRRVGVLHVVRKTTKRLG